MKSFTKIHFFEKVKTISSTLGQMYMQMGCAYFYDEDVVSAFNSCNKFTVLYVVDMIK